MKTTVAPQATLFKVASATAHNTDSGNAERFVALHGDLVRYVYEHNLWLAWDGRRWAPDALGMVERLARRVPAEMLRVAADVADDEARRKLVAWAMQSESAARIDAMMRLARSHEKIVLRAADLDADGWVLNVANGTVDLTTGELRAHRPADLQSKITTAACDPAATAPRWAAFLEEVLPDAEVRLYVQKLAGYSIAGDVGENVLPFPYGSGANGKSVFLHVIGEVLGDYATEAAPDLLVQRRERGIPVDVADLRGYRWVTTTEVEGGRGMATDVMKRITGEPRLKARLMRQNFESFENVTTLWMAGNDKPRVDGLDDAIWRRVKLLPFTVTIPEERRDPALARRLLEESNGILGWLLEGMALYRRDGLTAPAAVKSATDGYREESNPLREWLDAEEIALDAESSEQAAGLRKAYERWTKATGRARVPSGVKWRGALEGLGCEQRRTKAGNKWHGIRLAEPAAGGLGF